MARSKAPFGRPPGPGERRGGRAKGTPNKSETEKKILAERAAAAMSGRSSSRMLGKEVLEEYMMLFRGMSGYFQPLLGQPKEAKPQASIEQFEKWAKLAVEAATRLAPYQSPTYRSIMVMQPETPLGSAPPGIKTVNPNAMTPQEAYAALRDGPIIDGSVKRVGNG
jgi:hypothetical protein